MNSESLPEAAAPLATAPLATAPLATAPLTTTFAPPPPLQFDEVVDAGEPAPPVSCVACKMPIRLYYYHANSKTVCAACKDKLEQAEAARSQQQSIGKFLRAGLYGLGGALAGAAIYYGVMALLDLEIGIVAILIGYMVGKAVRKGAGVGGRRYQILAVALTYFAIGVAYAPMVMKDASYSSILMVFAIPVIIIFGSLPMGLISAIIIGIGMRQAWRMTAASEIHITGPFKLSASAQVA